MTKSSGIENLNDIWLKASVTGSLWASFEIIAGSLLHNLHIPFSGSILTAFAVILLISFSQLWPQQGMIWRAGLICAVMKSVSPSAVILGPMIGIFSEALIIEMVILLAGRNIISYTIAGALALLSALIHKLLNLLIIYGFDLVDIYTNLFNYTLRQLGISGGAPENMILLLTFIYIITGILSAFAGIYIGHRALSNKKQVRSLSFSPLSPVMVTGNSFPYKISSLAAHLAFIPFALYIFSISNYLIINAFIAFLYFIICVSHYRYTSGRLLKPYFWIQLSVIMILSALFLESSAPGKYSILKGLTGATEMFLRALVLITAFSSISAELLNPVIKNYLMSHGFRKLYASLQLSFSALPSILQNTSGNARWLKNPLNSISDILNDAENWLESFKKNSVL